MEISVSEDKTYGFKPVKINTLEDLSNEVTTLNWSCGIYENGHRSSKNFKYADFIALDIDGGMRLDIAREKFKHFKHLICTSKSHQIPKNGVIEDRYRVILQLSRRVTDPDEFYGAWQKLKSSFPAIDSQCPDPSRLWYPSPKVVQSRWADGKLVEPVKIERSVEAVDTKIGIKGNITKSTLDFLFNGTEAGRWNSKLYECALDLKSQGYTKEESVNTLQIATRNFEGNLNNKDMDTIDSAYNADTRHDKRGVDDCFDFELVGDIIKDKREIGWLVKDLLTVGGLSIIAGAPKSGKSTIIRQLGKCVAQGIPFLERPVAKGKVLYLALEEQRELLAQQLRQLGVKSDDEFYIHAGPVFATDKFKSLEEAILDIKPSLVVIDTMILFAGSKDINNYNEMYMILSQFRNIARKGNTHINFVHHQNKGENRGAGSIMGSGAIHGSVDNAIIFNSLRGARYMTTSQRGGVPFTNTFLEFDMKTQSYRLGDGPEF